MRWYACRLDLGRRLLHIASPSRIGGDGDGDGGDGCRATRVAGETADRAAGPRGAGRGQASRRQSPPALAERDCPR